MATTSAAARESRRRKLVDRGADRLALITGRIESLPPDSSNNPIADSSQPTIFPDPPTHLADERTVPSSIKDEDFSSVPPNLAAAADTEDLCFFLHLNVRYYFSLYLELSDITMPMIRVVIEKVSNAISFFLVSLIGRSLGLIYTGIRQSLRWK